MQYSLKYFGIVLTVAIVTLLAGFPLPVTSAELVVTEADVVEGSDWPREITTNKGVIVVYQPQPEELEGDMLKARAAVAFEVQGQSPVFGVVWFHARLETDRAERTAIITDLTINEVRFPNQTEEKTAALTKLLESDIPISGTHQPENIYFIFPEDNIQFNNIKNNKKGYKDQNQAQESTDK